MNLNAVKLSNLVVEHKNFKNMGNKCTMEDETSFHCYVLEK